MEPEPAVEGCPATQVYATPQHAENAHNFSLVQLIRYLFVYVILGFWGLEEASREDTSLRQGNAKYRIPQIDLNMMLGNLLTVILENPYINPVSISFPLFFHLILHHSYY